MKTIKKNKPVIVIEFAPDRVQFLKTPANTLQELIDYGYRAFAIFKDGSMWEVDSMSDYVMRGALSSDPHTEKKLARQNSNDLLFVPAERMQLDG